MMNQRGMVQAVLGFFQVTEGKAPARADAVPPHQNRFEIEREILGHEYAARVLRTRLERGKKEQEPGARKKEVPGASAEAVMRRKVETGYADLQVLVLFVLAKREMLTLSDLAEELGVGTSSAWYSAQVMVDHGLVKEDRLCQRFKVSFYYLSDEGKRKLAWLLRGDEKREEVPSGQ